MSLNGLRDWFDAQPRVLLIDLDGTLVDSAADIRLALNRALNDLAAPPVSEEQVRAWVGRGAARLIETALSQVLPHHDHALSEQVLARFMVHYQASVCEASTVYPGVHEFLAAARAAGIRLACITNKPYAPAVALLEALDLIDNFELLLGGDSLAHKKPHPEPLLHALRHFQVEPGQALMIGDSRNDVEAARAAGVKVVALTYGYNHGEPIAVTEPDRLVDSLAELL